MSESELNAYTVEGILQAAAKAGGGQWAVRKTVDDSGDYPFPTYDIITISPYGPEGIGTAFQNPYNAILFSGAKVLAGEVVRLRAELAQAKSETNID